MILNIFKSTNDTKSTSQNFLLILLAKFVSDFGAFMNMVALSSYIFYLSNSPFMVGIFLACRVSGGMFTSLISNNFFRYLPGKNTLAGLDFTRAACLSPLLLITPDLHLIIIPFIGFILGMSNSLFSIGLNSQLAHFVGKHNLANTNSWITTLSSIGMVIGALSSGLIIALLNYDFVFTLNIMSYLTAALCISFLRNTNTNQGNQEKNTQSLKQDINTLRQALKKSPIISAMLIVTLADTLGSASHNVGFPILAKFFDNQNSAQVMGYIIATWAVGKLTGALSCKWLGFIPNTKVTEDKNSYMEKAFFLAIIIMSSGFIFAFNQGVLFMSLIAFFIAGMGDGVSEVCFITRAQQTHEKIRLPLFSSISFMQNTGFGLGMLISAISFEFFSTGIVVGAFHGLPICVVLMVYFWSRKKQ